MKLQQLIFLIISIFILGCQTDSEVGKALNEPKLARVPLLITWTLEKNGLDADKNNRQYATFSIKNIGTTTIKDNWTIYFNQLYGPITGPSITGNVQLTHINGSFFSLKPAKGFTLEPDATAEIKYEGNFWAIKESDAPAGLYLVFQNEAGEEETPKEIEKYTILPFTSPEQINRMPNDKFPIPTNEYRYEQNAKLTKLNEGELKPVIPSPKMMLGIGQGTLTIDDTYAIHYHSNLKGEADYLNAELETLGFSLKTYESGSNVSKSIVLTTSSIPIAGKSSEAYRIIIDPGKELVWIEGTDAAGVFYGIQTLKSLIPPSAYGQNNKSLSFAANIVEDGPRFEYRGLMLDVSRNFQTKKVVKKLLDLMGNYKLNKFHFHLTDDEGWRLAIPGLPELTEIGAKRGHSLTESDRLFPAYGSGPSTAEKGFAGSGFYTTKDYMEILKYAKDRHIEVIPEIDLPGHARAAIVAMKARQKRLMAEGQAEAANQYLLNDIEDKSEYRTAQNYNDNVINVCMESTYNFMEKVVDELVLMHVKAGVPLKTLHTGGDEVPAGAWQKSPLCADLVTQTAGLEGDKIALTNYFMTRFAKILEERDLIVAGWEEIALLLAGHGHPRRPNPQFVNNNFLPYVWNAILGWGGEDIAYQLANMGYKVVLCNASNLYFDLAYDKDPQNPGLYWAGFVNTRTAYDFAPFDLFKTVQMGRFGENLEISELEKGKVKLNPDAQKNIVGIQGQLWSEALINPERLERAMFPKLMGLAERAWSSQPSWATEVDEKKRFTALEKDWNIFTNTIGQKEMTRLDYMSGGVKYHIPPPGAKIEDGILYANTAFPGLQIRYTLDGSEPTVTSTEYTEPLEVKGDVRLKVFSKGGNESRSTLVKKDLVN